MTEVLEHLERVLDIAHPLPPLEVRLADAVGCVLAHDVQAPTDLPTGDVAALDGYALRSYDVDGATYATPVQLRVLDTLGAGSTDPGSIVELTAMRIASGAVLPEGADAVVPLDGTDMGEAIVNIHTHVDPGDNVRAQASDVEEGQVVLRAGVRIDARHIALLAGLGFNRVVVHPRPRVVVVSVGDELVEPGKPGGVGNVFDANGHALSTAVQAVGAAAFRVSAVPDEHVQLRETLEDQLVRADLIVTTGGLSYGAQDTVKDVLHPLGTVRFDNVHISPGRQFGVGKMNDDTPILCLPGDPVSAQIGFEIFVRPALLAMSGYAELYRPTVKATLTQTWDSPRGRREFVPVKLSGRPGAYEAHPTTRPGSTNLSGLAQANALLVIAQNHDRAEAGQEFSCLVLSEW